MPGADSLLHLLVALAAVLAVGQLLGRAFSQIGQPAVIGEVVAGMLLGPSVFGRVAPGLSDLVMPPAVAGSLNHVAQLGAVLYMFLVGVELEFDALRTHARATTGIALAGIVVPFGLGLVLGLALYPYGSAPTGTATTYALFLGVVLSVTAFPVLARILADGGLQHSSLGRLALTCAAVADVAAWCLLALVMGVAQAGLWAAAGRLALTAAFVALMVAVARPAMGRLANPATGSVSRSTFAAVMLALLASAAATEALGVHAIFGAFLLGTLVPPDSALARALLARLDDIVTVVLLPAFFAVTGLRMELGMLAHGREWAVLGVVLLVASAGKIGATAVAGRLFGQDWRTALGLGALMNTRGLMQIIVLTIGLDLGVFSQGLFTILALAALAATLLTAPALHALGVWSPPRKRIGSAGGAA